MDPEAVLGAGVHGGKDTGQGVRCMTCPSMHCAPLHLLEGALAVPLHSPQSLFLVPVGFAPLEDFTPAGPVQAPTPSCSLHTCDPQGFLKPTGSFPAGLGFFLGINFCL